MDDSRVYAVVLCLLTVNVGNNAFLVNERDESEINPSDSILDQIAKVNEMNDQNLYEADIILTYNESVVVDESSTGDVDGKFQGIFKKNAKRNRNDLWKNKVVPYIIDAQLTSVTSVIRSAINEVQSQTCIRFIRRTNEDKWIHFVKKIGCWSFVGRTSSKGAQEVSIGNGCQYKGIVMHELLHALGFWHEQSRPDRNQYVEILWENIKAGKEHNFNKYSHGKIDTLKAPYDLQSIMHYGKFSFSKNGKPTVLSIRDPTMSLGQRNGFTKTDIFEVNALYDCSGPSNGWSSWSDFGPCDNNCRKVRQRFCSSSDVATNCPGANFNGIQEQAVTCPSQECKAPIDGHWGRWSSWSQCGVTCGQGSHTRTRRCSDPPPQNGGKPCPGDSIMSRTCKRRSCGLGPDDCEFEVNSCHWHQKNSSNTYKWFRHQGKTLSINTGPDGDISKGLNGRGYYIYAEASGKNKGDRTELESKTFPATSARCIKFAYNMYGALVGFLNVYVVNAKTGAKRAIFTMNGNQGLKWYKKEITFSSRNDFKIIFEAVRGEGFESDVALDDIMFSSGKCRGPLTTAKPNTTRPSTVLTTTERPSTPLPSKTRPTTKQATTTRPSTALPSTARPTTTRQTTTRTTVFPTTPGRGDDCNFDQDFCYWRNGSTSKYPWIRKSFSTPSSGTGPSRDHTTGTGYYVYVEASNMKASNQTATLVSKVFPPFCIRCMSFYYHMYGNDMGTLNVYIRKFDINKQYKIFTKTGNQGNKWHGASVSFRSSYKYKIILESVRGSSYLSDIAVDDVSFTDGPCPTPRPYSTIGTSTTRPSTAYPNTTIPSTSLPTSTKTATPTATTFIPTTSTKNDNCNFDRDMCYWTIGRGTSKYPWRRLSRRTPSSGTGPSRDHTSGSGYYVYVETSFLSGGGQTATLVSKVFPAAPAGRCMSFFYHMYGSTMGTLNVYLQPLGTRVKKIRVFTKSGNQGNKWHSARVTIRSYYKYKIILESVRGSSYLSDIAVDDVSFTDGPCPTPRPYSTIGTSTTRPSTANPRTTIPNTSLPTSTKTPTPTPTTFTPTTPTKNDNCNFDRDMCYWTNGRGTSKYPWRRFSRQTPSSGTGPSRDHTSGSGYYVYVETSFLSGSGQTATLVSKVFPAAPAGRCMSFFYHMYGSTMGTLNVYVQPLGTRMTKIRVFTKSGNQGNKWHSASVTIRSYYKYKIILESVRGSSYLSDIAVDDVSFTNAPCLTQAAVCNFDKDYCFWRNGGGTSKYSWTRKSFSTPSSGTGPSRDHTTGTGYYVYVETSFLSGSGQTATLVSKVFPAAPAGRCMSFFYHMYGSTMGTLNVYVQPLGTRVKKIRVFTKSGNQGNKWHSANVTIGSIYKYEIVFESVKGSSYTGDIALDDITIKDGPCASSGGSRI